jgi:hypothetical protein
MSKDVHVSVNPSPPPKWKLQHPGSSGNDPQGYPIVKLDNLSGPQLVIFDLPGGHKFNDDPAIGPIWIDTQKPTSKFVHPDITDVKLFDGGKTLVILDKNSTQAKLHYQLNIKGPHGPDNLDPIIDNGGGTYPPPPGVAASSGVAGSPAKASGQAMDFMGLGIALVIGLVLGFFAHRLFFK